MNLPPRRPILPVLLFVATALFLPCGVFSFQIVTWFAGQIALASLSADFLNWIDRLSLLAQGAALLFVLSPMAFASRDPRFRPIYQSWFIAAAFAIPATALRFIPEHRSELGALAQIALAMMGSTAAFIVRRKSLAPFFDFRTAVASLATASFTFIPFMQYGALGSVFDTIQNLAVALAFGLFAAILVSPTAENYLLNGLGAGVLLSLLGSAYGAHGSQLLLAAILPIFGFALGAFSTSVLSSAIFAGLIAAAPLLFFDPVELTILLGGSEISSWAARASELAIGIGMVLATAVWVVGLIARRVRIPTLLSVGGAVAAWVGAFAIYFSFGQPGFYGEQFFVILKDQADVSSAVSIADRNERLAYVYRTLTEHATRTQADLRQTLDQFGAHYKPYYLVNAIEVDGSPLLRLYLSRRPDVDRILDSPHLRPLPEPLPVTTGSTGAVAEVPGWNIKMIGADRVWNEFGVTGRGITVGQSDSGMDGQHPALRDAYRGLNNGDAYNWLDPWAGSTSPTDHGGHGTHTLGTILGAGGIGVAPGAQWIGCVNLERNLGNPPVYLDCMQFMLAPFPQDGDPFIDGDPTRAAHVLNDSWGCPPIEGCDANALKPAADALRAAGIFVVVSTGNDGPNCSTVTAPLSLYDSVFSVGAVDRNGNVAEFSSRGPVAVDGSGRLKPDIAAPGVDVFSSMPGGTYESNSGTSMAGPHVVGVVALLWSAQPELIGDIDRTEQIIIQTAQPYNGERSLGCFDGDHPDNAVGYGIVDAYAAVKMALER